MLTRRNSSSNQKRMKLKFIYLLCLIVVACSDGLNKPIDEECPDSPVEIMTKGNGDGRSYIFYLIGYKNTSTQGKEYFGTYVDAEIGCPMIPAEVDLYGKPISGNYDSSKGLRASNGGYKLFVSSPAETMTDVGDGSGVKGYHYTRNDEGVYVSDPVDVTLGGVYLTDAEGTDYIYNVSDQVMRQPRSRLKLKFACGADLEKATLQSVNLKNFISEGFYIPVERRFHYFTSDIQENDRLFPKDENDALTVKTGEVVNLNVDEYILSMNYGELNAEGQTIFPMPSLEICIGDLESSIVIFNAALGLDFKPQHSYEFTITINSVYVNMSVAVSSWDPKDAWESEVGETETWKIDFHLNSGSVNLFDWEYVEKQTGTIG